MPSIGARTRRLKNRTLVAPLTTSLVFAAFHSRFQRQCRQAVTAEGFTARVLGFGEGRVGIAKRHRVAQCTICAALLK
jgi:hypothetical protein